MRPGGPRRRPLPRGGDTSGCGTRSEPARTLRILIDLAALVVAARNQRECSMAEEKMTTEAPGATKFKPDKTVVRALALGGLLGGCDPAAVDVKDGKIVRVRPMHFDWKYPRDSFRSWKFQRNGQTLESNFKGMPSPWSLAYKKRTYSPNRIQYPLKRVDWDPNGERNPQNRGKSKYVRISWDEATDIIASELKRLIETYGPLAVLAQGDGHGECKTINTPHGHHARLMEMLGGFTQQVRNPDSWEGFYWGSKHVWGQGIVGMMDPSDNCVKDMIENCDLVLFWGCDPETTPWGFVGQFASRLSFFWTECGIKQIYICPDLNYGAAVHADKWIPVLPNTDAACSWPSSISGSRKAPTTRSTWTPTPWAWKRWKPTSWATRTGSPRRPSGHRRSAAFPSGPSRRWPGPSAKNTLPTPITSAGPCSGAPIPTSRPASNASSWACRAWAARVVHQIQFTYVGMPRAELIRRTPVLQPPAFRAPHETCPDHDPGLGQAAHSQNPHPQGHSGSAPSNSGATAGSKAGGGSVRRVRATPFPRKKGGTEIHMMWTDTPCRITCWNCGNDTIIAERDPQDRVHPGPAPLAGERLSVRRHHSAHQHQPGSGRHRHQHPPGDPASQRHPPEQGDRPGG